jgi:hypothetical protein
MYSDDDLSVEEQRTLDALITYTTKEQAAAALGISRRTLYRRLESTTLREAERVARSMALSDATASLHNAALRAVVSLTMIMENPEAPFTSRVAAANHLLTLAYKTYYDEDLEERLRAVEAELS